uniref:Uncharacterized protein n=1 Tax=Anguilla anguilla TaxID=7936 RepID=A0A0E9W8X8_ANGAN
MKTKPSSTGAGLKRGS